MLGASKVGGSADLLGASRMGGAPGGDFAVVARQEDFGNLEATEVGGLGVLGIFKIVAVREAFNGGRGGAAEDAGQETGDGVNNDEGGQLPTGEDVVAEGDGVVNKGEDTLVVAFVVGAEDDEVESGGGGLVGGGRLTGRGGTGSKGADQILIPDLPDGSGEDDFGGGVGSLDALNRGEYWLAAQEHTVAAAVRSIVYRAMWAETEIAQVNVINFNNAAVLSLEKHRAVQIRAERLGKKGDDGETDEWLHIYIISYFAR